MTGILIKLVSTLVLVSMSALIRGLGPEVPVGEIVFCRNFFALIPIVIWIASRGDVRAGLATDKIGANLVRGILGVASMFCSFWALSRLALPDNTAIGYASPLVVVILAAVVLHERVRIHRWSAVGVGFCGIVIILWPHLAGGQLAAALSGGSDGAETALGALFALFGTLLSAAAMIQVRQLVLMGERTGTIVFYFTCFAALTGLCTLPLGWVVPDPRTAAMFVAIGLCGGIGQLLLTACYRYADASLLAFFDYTSMIWSVTIGWFAFGDAPTAYVLVGAAIVITAGIYVILRERKLGIAPPPLIAAAPASLR
ncbi:MAG TPA: DMT family transporter [Hyphomicrobiales bacterium]|nr:DMT family transporter [Hyphomicrobiales bacterium]